MKLKIDGHEVILEEKTTLFHAAQKVGIDIPVMCYKEGYDYFTSCMICIVKDKTSGRTFPACSAEALDGMDIETECEEIREARKSTLELLLSEHVGDCEAPCRRVCPISSEIPKMIREVMDDQLEDAIATVRRDMAIPSILERYCNAPCENGCRRGKYDEGLSIRELTRYTGDWDLRRETPYLPPIKPATGKTIAVVGAGPTGLSCAYYLAKDGHTVTVYEAKAQAGGRIPTEFQDPPLPDWVLAGEIGLMERMGVRFLFQQALGTDITLTELQQQYSAVALCIGDVGEETLNSCGIPTVPKKGVKSDPKTFSTGTNGLFAGGSITKGGQPLIKSVTTAKQMAANIDQFLAGLPMTGIYDMYNHAMGRLLDGEIDTFVSGADPRPRVHADDLLYRGYTPEEARAEATRCMHCDCREMHNCKLRTYSDTYGARQQQFKGEEREEYQHVNQNAGAVYEPGKCIKCGLCVRVTKDEGEEFGFTFVGRGFDLKTAVPLNKTLSQGLERVATLVVEACPTGALAANEKYIPLSPSEQAKADQAKADRLRTPLVV